MKITIAKTPAQLGAEAGKAIAAALREAIDQQGEARLLLSTGASQFDTLSTLIGEPLPWDRVSMFHLDEYVGLPISHKASFRKYLQERFVDKLPALAAVHFVDGEGDLSATLGALNEAISKAPIDVAAIGIGENAHIAFNDPPADFDVESPYIVVTLDEACRRQQVGEGWFATVEDVPRQAISMSVRQIMRSRRIISCVPHAVKADAIYRTLTAPEVTNLIPATMLRTHPSWSLYLDSESAGQLDRQWLLAQEDITLREMDGAG